MIAIEYASTTQVDRYREVAADFMGRMLGLKPEDYVLTDESRLSHLGGGFALRGLYARVRGTYGVDVSDLEDGNLARIFARIAAANPARVGAAPPKKRRTR